MLRQHGGEAEGERGPLWLGTAELGIVRSGPGNGDDLRRVAAVRKQKGGAQALQRFDERRLLNGKLDIGISAGLQRQQRMTGAGHPAAVPGLGEVVFRDGGEDRRIEKSFKVGRRADGGVGEFARDGGGTSKDSSGGERQRRKPGQAGTGGVVRGRNERGTNNRKVAGVEALEDAGLLRDDREGWCRGSGFRRPPDGRAAERPWCR